MDTSVINDVAVNVSLTFYQVQILRELAIKEKRVQFEKNGGAFENDYINELMFIDESFINVLDETTTNQNTGGKSNG